MCVWVSQKFTAYNVGVDDSGGGSCANEDTHHQAWFPKKDGHEYSCYTGKNCWHNGATSWTYPKRK